MSRIGKKPIVIPSGVDITITGSTVTVKGAKGTITYEVNSRASVVISDGENGKELKINVANTSDSFGRSIWGTTRANLANLIKGVTEGFSKSLEVIGVGYKVNVQGQKIVLEVGFSHDV
ncbi:MAG: 50S ribosomal protein L6, partial [Patescibacteria group bacterium]